MYSSVSRTRPGCGTTPAGGPFWSSSPQLGGGGVLSLSWSPQSKTWKRPEDPEASAAMVPGSVGSVRNRGFLWLPVPFLVSSTAKADGTWRREQKGFIPAGEEAESGVNGNYWGA